MKVLPCCDPKMWGFSVVETKIREGVDILRELWKARKKYGNSNEFLLAVVVKMLAQGDDLASDVCVFFYQVSNAFATIENGCVVASPQ